MCYNISRKYLNTAKKVAIFRKPTQRAPPRLKGVHGWKNGVSLWSGQGEAECLRVALYGMPRYRLMSVDLGSSIRVVPRAILPRPDFFGTGLFLGQEITHSVRKSVCRIPRFDLSGDTEKG